MSADEIIFGIHAVSSVINANPQCISEIYFADFRKEKRIYALYELAESQQLNIVNASRAQLESLVPHANHQGVIARCHLPRALDEHQLMQLLDRLQSPPFLLVLDCIQDPHNLGACLRTADAAGVHAVVIPKNKSVGVTGTVAKVSSGAVFSVPIVQVTNLSRTLKNLKKQGLWLVATDADSEQPVYELDMTGPIAVVMGAEGSGLRRLTREECDFSISIPLRGSVSSLNVSVATGVVLYEALRQRRVARVT